jgi:L-rhamnose mutarotase
VIQLSPKDEADYIRYHQQVWPEVLRTIADCNIANYSIFLRNGILFAYFEYTGADYAADLRKMADCPHMQRWWTLMDPMQVPMPDAERGEKWSPLREVFYFDPATHLATQLERAD